MYRYYVVAMLSAAKKKKKKKKTRSEGVAAIKDSCRCVWADVFDRKGPSADLISAPISIFDVVALAKILCHFKRPLVGGQGRKKKVHTEESK